MEKSKSKSRKKHQMMTMLTSSPSHNMISEDMEDIIMEILLRLPAKSLARFKCASIKWNQFICRNPFFRMRYRDISGYALLLGIFHQTQKKIGFLPTSDQGNMLVNNNNTNPLDETLSFLGDDDENTYRVIVASSNRFLLCRLRQSHAFNYFICDPITKECFPLPKPKHLDRSCRWVLHCQGDFNAHLHYIVVVYKKPQSLNSPRPGMNNRLTIQVLSSVDSMHEWKKIDLICSSPFRMKINPAVISEAGILYFPVGTETHLHAVVFFDLQHDHSSELEMIVLPGEAGRGYGSGNTGRVYFSRFGKTYGLIVNALCYLQNNDYHLEMWALDEHKKEWLMRYRVNNLGPRLNKKPCPCIEGLHPLNPRVLFLTFGTRLKAWYNVESKRMELVHVGPVDLMVSRSFFPYIYPAAPFLFCKLS